MKIVDNVKKASLSLGVATFGVLTTAVPVFAAEGADASAVDALKSGIAETKTQFMAVLAVVVVGAMGFFAVKYAISNGIGFFSKISKKG